MNKFYVTALLAMGVMFSSGMTSTANATGLEKTSPRFVADAIYKDQGVPLTLVHRRHHGHHHGWRHHHRGGWRPYHGGYGWGYGPYYDPYYRRSPVEFGITIPLFGHSKMHRSSPKKACPYKDKRKCRK